MNIRDTEKSHIESNLDKTDTHRSLQESLFYIIRKSSAFFMLWISIVLMFGIICAETNESGQDEFYRFIFFLQSPWVIVLNVLSLISALLCSFSRFNLISLTYYHDKNSTRILIIIGLLLITVILSVALFLTTLGYFR